MTIAPSPVIRVKQDLGDASTAVPPIARLDELQIWRGAPAALQQHIGTIALAYAIAAMGREEPGAEEEPATARALAAGEEALGHLLRAAVIEALPLL